MTKFSQIAQNGSPALTDFMVGVTSTNSDDIVTLQNLLTLFFNNVPNTSIKSQNIDFTTGIWWQELGRITLSSSATSMTTPTFAPKKYIKILISAIMTGGSGNINVQFNGDTAANYSHRFSSDGAADATGASVTSIPSLAILSGLPGLKIIEGVNIASAEKILYCRETVDLASGAGSIPDRLEQVGKWANTAAQINQVKVFSPSNSYIAGSEVVVLGHD